MSITDTVIANLKKELQKSEQATRRLADEKQSLLKQLEKLSTNHEELTSSNMQLVNKFQTATLHSAQELDQCKAKAKKLETELKNNFKSTFDLTNFAN